MPNQFDQNGLLTMTQAELLAYFTNAFYTIYGTDANLESDTPDGQWINTTIQAILDVQDQITEINSSFDPDNAIGVILDQRVAINGIQREGGTFTITPVSITASQTINLYGLDQTLQQVYTVADGAQNQWQLQTTQLGLASGTHSLNFQAQNPGAVPTTINTITVPVTVVLGVSSINNPSTYTTLGVNEESDALLKVRRQQSVSNGSQGYLAGLIGTLQNIPGVTYADVFENYTDTTNANGIPAHYIWAIIAGSGAASAIANAIYTKRSAGCGMYGQQSFTITQVDGSPFNVYWDDVITQNAFIAFTVTSINGTISPNIAAILAALPLSMTPGVNTDLNINEVATAVQAADPNTLVTGAGLSLAQTQLLQSSGTPASGAFKILYDGYTSASINWNDSISAIQTKVRAITGLTDANVTGSITGGLYFVFTALPGGVQGLVSVVSNTLLTAGSVAVTFIYTNQVTYVNVLNPSNLNYQLTVESANIYILPMQMAPATATVPHGTSKTFAGLGGYQPYTYSFSVNNSGGSINSTSGAYTAGSTANVIDTILVTDTFGNDATATVTVN